MKTDAELQKDVMDELELAPVLNATAIGVGVQDEVIVRSD